MLTWPHAQGDWGNDLADMEAAFMDIAHAIAKHESLIITCCDAVCAADIKQRLVQRGVSPQNLILAIAATNDVWIRDHGPLGTLVGTEVHLQDFRFNGWGNKYPAELDNLLTPTLAKQDCFGQTTVHSHDLVLEGGSIDCDGSGTLLTTRRCQLHPQRNPGLDQRTLEHRLAHLLGIERFLWLAHGCLEGDDTDCHVDMLVRFVNRNTLAYQSCNETGYSCYPSLIAMEQELQCLRTAEGKPYSLVKLPWSQPKFDLTGRRLTASYANFLIINAAVLVPTYDDPADDIAVATLQACFPGREVIGIDCLPLIQQNGSLHCVTMQLPVGTRIKDLDAGSSPA